MAGPLQWVRQKLGHTVMQLKGWPSQRHLVLIAGTLGIQASHEGKHVLWGQGRAVQAEVPLTGPPCPGGPPRRGPQDWVPKGKEEFVRQKTLPHSANISCHPLSARDPKRSQCWSP